MSSAIDLALVMSFAIHVVNVLNVSSYSPSRIFGSGRIPLS